MSVTSAPMLRRQQIQAPQTAKQPQARLTLRITKPQRNLVSSPSSSPRQATRYKHTQSSNTVLRAYPSTARASRVLHNGTPRQSPSLARAALPPVNLFITPAGLAGNSLFRNAMPDAGGWFALGASAVCYRTGECGAGAVLAG